MVDEGSSNLFANRRAESLFGFDCDGLLGRSVDRASREARRSLLSQQPRRRWQRARVAGACLSDRALSGSDEADVEEGVDQISTGNQRLIFCVAIDAIDDRHHRRNTGGTVDGGRHVAEQLQCFRPGEGLSRWRDPQGVVDDRVRDTWPKHWRTQS